MAPGDHSDKKYKVILADDSEDDRLFMRLALSQSKSLAVVAELTDGQEAIDYLSGQDIFSNRTKYPFPDVLILDLKMPRKNGYDVLEWLRESPFDALRVIVVSGSFLQADISRSFALGAHDYHKKSVLKEELEMMTQKIEALLLKQVNQ